MTIRSMLWSILWVTAVMMSVSPVVQAELVAQSRPGDILNPGKGHAQEHDGYAITLGTTLQQHRQRSSGRMSVSQIPLRRGQSVEVNLDNGFEVMFSLAQTGLPEEPVRQIRADISSSPLVGGFYQLATAPAPSDHNWRMATGVFVGSGTLASVELLDGMAAVHAYRPTLDNVAVNLTPDQTSHRHMVGLGVIPVPR